MFLKFSFVGLLLAIFAVYIITRYFDVAYKKKISRFSDREELTTEEIYNKYFSDKGIPKDAMIRLWDELADCIELPKGKLRPMDRFDRELAPEKGFEYDDPINGVFYLMKKKSQKYGLKLEYEKLETIADYIQFFGNSWDTRHNPK